MTLRLRRWLSGLSGQPDGPTEVPKTVVVGQCWGLWMIGPWLRILNRSLGVSRCRYPSALSSVDVTGMRFPPLEGCMPQARGGPFSDQPEISPAADHPLGNSVGAIGWPTNGPAPRGVGVPLKVGRLGSFCLPFVSSSLTNFYPLSRGDRSSRGVTGTPVRPEKVSR